MKSDFETVWHTWNYEGPPPPHCDAPSTMWADWTADMLRLLGSHGWTWPEFYAEAQRRQLE